MSTYSNRGKLRNENVTTDEQENRPTWIRSNRGMSIARSPRFDPYTRFEARRLASARSLRSPAPPTHRLRIIRVENRANCGV